MSNKWTPLALQCVANENGWRTKEYMTGARSYHNATHTLHVYFGKRGNVETAWLHDCKPVNGLWIMLDHKVSGKRDIVIRWLAGDYDAGIRYAI